MNTIFSIKEVTNKIEHFCTYQKRCHEEVVQKLRALKMDPEEIDRIMVHLIPDNFLNEERFTCSFGRGKHRKKHWGKIRIANELKSKRITQTLITIVLKEIYPDEYDATFNALAERHWESIRKEIR
ncbi:regulatory protein RecX [Flavobacterium gawalongense]|uniref:regulatory protein RecX n=1 Tax=Flavobacterium gawalongense TaxID=2594432 RepID=UPI002938EA17|nr:RecX family transcriptional regulator [Flavobacterium gawalongense]